MNARANVYAKIMLVALVLMLIVAACAPAPTAPTARRLRQPKHPKRPKPLSRPRRPRPKKQWISSCGMALAFRSRDRRLTIGSRSSSSAKS